jgi:hypothetical protein
LEEWRTRYTSNAQLFTLDPRSLAVDSRYRPTPPHIAKRGGAAICGAGRQESTSKVLMARRAIVAISLHFEVGLPRERLRVGPGNSAN